MCNFPTVVLTDTLELISRKKGGLAKNQVAGAVIGSFLFCLLVGLVTTTTIFLWMKYVKRNKRRKRIVRLSKGPLSAKNDIYNELSLLSPGAKSFYLCEFPRSNLTLQDPLGRPCVFTTICCACVCVCVPNRKTVDTAQLHHHHPR